MIGGGLALLGGLAETASARSVGPGTGTLADKPAPFLTGDGRAGVNWPCDFASRIVRLLYSERPNRGPVPGTGFAIAANAILTAAHVVPEDAPEKYKLEQPKVDAGGKIGPKPYRANGNGVIRKIIRHPDSIGGDFSKIDFAIVLLEQPMFSTPIKLSPDYGPGQRSAVFGYPNNRLHYSIGVTHQICGDRLFYSHRTAEGLSGGPVVPIPPDDKSGSAGPPDLPVVAVHVAGPDYPTQNASSCPTQLSRAVPLTPEIITWIKAQIA